MSEQPARARGRDSFRVVVGGGVLVVVTATIVLAAGVDDIESDHVRADRSSDLAGRSAAAALTPVASTQSMVTQVVVEPGDDGRAAVTVHLTADDDRVPQIWEAELAYGAAVQRYAATRSTGGTLDQVVSSAVAVGPGADGRGVTSDLGVGAAALGQSFASPSDENLRAHVDEVAGRFGLSVSSVRVLHPLGSALSVALVVPDDAEVGWTIDRLCAALAGAHPDVEGLLVELDAPDGTPLLQTGRAYRTGGGGLWFAPGQDTRFGARHGFVAGAHRGR